MTVVVVFNWRSQHLAIFVVSRSGPKNGLNNPSGTTCKRPKAPFQSLKQMDISVALVTRKCFIPALAGEQYCHVLTREGGHIIQSDCGRLTYRLLHVPHIFAKAVPEFFRRDRDFVVLRTK